MNLTSDLRTSLVTPLYNEGGSKLGWGPKWNNLRPDPRFQKLITDVEATLKARASKRESRHVMLFPSFAIDL